MEEKILLHWSPRSPYVKKVVVAAEEIGISDRIEQVRSVVPTDNPAHAIYKDNPLGRIPAIVTPDGQKWHGSSMVLQYFDSIVRADVQPLYPRDDSLALLQARQLEVLGDGVLEILMAWMMEWYLPTSRKEQKFANSAHKVNQALDFLESHIDWLHSAGVNAGSITAGCMLSYLDFRFSKIVEWRDDRPEITQWHRQFEARDSMVNNPFAEG